MKINNGIGLINILNRSESLNGLIEFNYKPRNGFRLKVAIPVNNQLIMKIERTRYIPNPQFSFFQSITQKDYSLNII